MEGGIAAIFMTNLNSNNTNNKRRATMVGQRFCFCF